MYANKVKKVVAVHDLSGVGRVSLTVVIPILSSMGFQVCPLPTAVLSSHTQYPEFSFLDLTDENCQQIHTTPERSRQRNLKGALFMLSVWQTYIARYP